MRTLGTIIAITVVDTRGRRQILLYTLPILSVVMILISAFTYINVTDDTETD